MPHIVDTLIEERAEQLMRKPIIWSAIKKLIYPILGYERAIEVIDFIQDMKALDVFDYVSDTLQMNLECEGLENLPAHGLVIVLCNHPAGVADGIAVFDAFKNTRRDISFFANRDAVRVCPDLAEMIVPVEWVDDKRDHAKRKETVRSLLKAFRNERVIVIFPSGRLAQPTLRGLVEREWQSTAMTLALRYACPVIPMHIRGRNSLIYYLFYLLHAELRDMTLFRELFNKQGQRYQITLAKPFIAIGDAELLSAELRRFVTEEMPRGSREFHPAKIGEKPRPANQARL